MAIEEINKGDYPESVVSMVRQRAEGVLTEYEARNGMLVKEALAESRRLVSEMNGFVALFDPKEDVAMRMLADEAEQRVRSFLDHCRKLDRELSAIPSRLRVEGMSARDGA